MLGTLAWPTVRAVTDPTDIAAELHGAREDVRELAHEYDDGDDRVYGLERKR